MFVLVYDWQWIQAAIFISHITFFIFTISAGRNAKANVNFDNWSFHISYVTNVLGSLSPYLMCRITLNCDSKQTDEPSLDNFLIFFLLFCLQSRMCADQHFFLFLFLHQPKSSLNEGTWKSTQSNHFHTRPRSFQVHFSHFVYERSNICMDASQTADQSVCLCWWILTEKNPAWLWQMKSNK